MLNIESLWLQAQGNWKLMRPSRLQQGGRIVECEYDKPAVIFWTKNAQVFKSIFCYGQHDQER